MLSVFLTAALTAAPALSSELPTVPRVSDPETLPSLPRATLPEKPTLPLRPPPDTTLPPPRRLPDLDLPDLPPLPPKPVIPIAPALEARCAPLQQAPTGTGALFDLSCQRAFVLPPAKGDVRVAQFTPNANIQQCPAMLNLHTQVDATLAKMKEIKTKIDAYLASFDQMQANVKAAEAAMDAAQRARLAADTDLTAAANTKIQLQAAVDEAEIDLEACNLLAESPGQCTAETAALNDAKANLAVQLTAYTQARAVAAAADAEYTRAFNAYSAAFDQLTSALDPILTLEAQLAAVSLTVLDTYKTYAALEGATGKLTYTVPWDAVINDFRNRNSTRSLAWNAVTIDSAKFAASTILNNTPTDIPALLWATYPGDGATGGTPADAGMQVMGRGGQVTATIGLGLTGACPFFPTGRLTTAAVTPDASQLAAYVVANVSYQYQVVVSQSFRICIDQSPIVIRLKNAGVNLDVFAPGKFETVVRTQAQSQSFKNDVASLATQHASVLQSIDTSFAVQKTLKAEAQASLGRPNQLASLRATDGTGTIPPLTTGTKIDMKKLKYVPYPKPIQVVYEYKEISGSLTFVP